MRKASIICFLFYSLVGPTPSIEAQDPVATPKLGSPPQVHPGQTIWVTTSDGRELSGNVLSVSVSTLAMTAPDGKLSMPVSEIRTIEIRDSLKNGARNGALIGGLSLGIYMGALSYSLRCERDCGADYSAARDTIGGVAFGIGAGAGVGALAGLLVDALAKGRQIVYAAASHNSRSWQIWPTIAEKRLKVYARVHWE